MTTPIGSSSSQPAQTPSTLDAFDDTMSELYTAMSKLRENDVEAGQGQVIANEAETQREESAERAAIQQEQANAANSGRGFFSSIGHIVGDVAGDLVHGRIGSAIDDGSRDVSEAWNSPEFWSDLTTGLKDVAEVAAAASAVVLTAGAGVAVGAAALAIGAVSATATAGAALAGVRSGQFAANAEDASADATAATDKMNELQQVTGDVISDLKQTDKSHARSLQSVTQAIQTNDDAAIAPASMTVRG
ncbi:MAG TPA: hypothetical protein VII82_06085 [Polyangiaceae bacterium]